MWLGFHTINIGIKCLATRLVLSCTIKADFSPISENPLSCLDPLWHFTKISSFFSQWFWPCSNPNGVTPSGSSAFTQESSWKSHISWATEKIMLIHWCNIVKKSGFSRLKWYFTWGPWTQKPLCWDRASYKLGSSLRKMELFGFNQSLWI